MIAKRLQSVDSSAIRNALNTQVQDHHFVDLTVGFTAEATSQDIKNAAIQAIDDDRTEYTPANGLPELREAIAQKLVSVNGIAANKDTVAVLPGLTTGILITYLALLDPGDQVIIADPYFPPYQALAGVAGAEAVTVDTYPDFRFTADKIAPHITEKTKMIVVNTPNNPTGSIYTEAELKEIASLAAANDLIICSDEVYEYFDYEGDFFSIGSIYPKTITMNSFSKSYAMTGWRIGYINGPREVIDAINELLQYAVFSSSSVGQYAALEAIKTPPSRDPSYLAKRDLVRESMGKYTDIAGMQGAFFSFFPVIKGFTDMEFVEYAHHNGVLILPGSAFSKKSTHVRLSYGGDYECLQVGLSRLDDIITTKL